MSSSAGAVAASFGNTSPAIGFLNVQIAEQQRERSVDFGCGGSGTQALLCLEHIKQPFFQLADLRLDVAEQTVCRFDTAVQFAALGGNAFFSICDAATPI